jgi:hypothetical protein
MKFEHQALSFALALAALIPACYVVSEKPADSAPPVGAAGATTVPATTATATPTAPPLTTTTATAPTATPRPPSLHAPKPLPTFSAGGAGGVGGAGGSGGGTP